MKPIGNRVVIDPIEASSTTESGLVISGANNDMVAKGNVVSVGEGKFTIAGEIIPVPVKECDVVYYYKSTAVKVPGTKLMLLDADQILARD